MVSETVGERLDICTLDTEKVTVCFNLTIASDFSWSLSICGKKLSVEKCTALTDTSASLMSVHSVYTFLKKVCHTIYLKVLNFYNLLCITGE